MPRKAKAISAVQIDNLPVGFHAAGGATGLYLKVSSVNARNWILRAVIGNRRRDMGLGGWPDVSLADARDRARQARRLIELGKDPIHEREKAKEGLRVTPSFSECARHTIEAKRPEWKNAKHAAQWKRTLETYAYPVIGNMPVDQVELRDIVQILTPLWTEKTETASRVRSRIEAVLAWAKVSGYRQGDNPARWKGNLDVVLPKPSKVTKVKHHPALPVDALPAFMKELRKREGISIRALEFLILTAARSSEALGATWQEIDLDTAVWVIPAERMKAGKEHRVPLSRRVLSLLRTLPRVAGSDYVFPAAQGGQLSDMALSSITRRMKVDAVPHGFRSTFRDWASERTSYPGDVAEMALAHTIPDKVEAAYRRGDLFNKRTKMMADWAAFAGGGK